ncbi:hypothetical protein [Rhizobium sp. WYJ-E13]|uniref:hypothetical protein n=1 Tax=Rhizobium sp. WYJ-E13 TaxID=2849093 RepID=UPI001C1F0B6C|nr:hypothetical protein [Rhizobium sp. WYJ-E13]QWW69016.1 hypothetical protein KQ933_04725 [Rhizobium sp. WYJ-E13]
MREIERTKYLANAIDRASTSCLTVGVFAPIAAALYSATGTIAATFTFVIGAFCWLSAAVALHLAGRRALKGVPQ